MREYIKELIKRKDLLIYLVMSGLKAQHRNTFLGYFWWLLDPLLLSAVYYFVVVVIFNRGGENFGLYLVIGMITWRWLASTITGASRSIIGQGGIISQVYLPKMIFPLGAGLTQLVNFSFGLIVIAIFLAFFRVVPGVEVLWLPVIIIVQQLFLIAISLVVAYISVFVRDIENLLGPFKLVWFFGSPVIWIREDIPANLLWMVNLNPAAALLDSYRNVLMHGSNPEFFKLFIMGIASLIVIAVAIYYYNKNEHKIIKVL